MTQTAFLSVNICELNELWICFRLMKVKIRENYYVVFHNTL
jgi:hypothetical protein